jgi:TonB family protein
MTGSIAHRTLASPRIPALAGIAALHVLIAYLLLTALVQRPLAAPPPPPMMATVITDPAPPVPTPPPAQPGPTTRERFTQTFSIPELHFTPPVLPEAPVTSNFVPPGPTSVPLPEPIRVIGKHWLPSSEDYYPPDLIRIGVQGSTQLRVCVDEAGQLSGAPLVEQSSGNARLDQGALNVARAGRYARSVRGDTPVPNCYHFRIVFKVR